MAIHQPHDHLFKRVFGAPAEAASFLQARLPARLSRALRWPTLKRLPASFVAPDLRGTASDLLFEIRYAAPGAAQPPLWLYLLFEHQSTPDYWLRLRLLGYCCRIWEHDRREHKDAGYLRPILPLVFYRGHARGDGRYTEPHGGRRGVDDERRAAAPRRARPDARPDA